VLRRFSSAIGASWLAVVSLQAPFAHEHPDDPDHHHAAGRPAAGFMHGHFDLDHGDGVAIEDREDSESAVWLDWAPAAQPRIEVVYVANVAPFPEAELQVSLGSVPEFTPRSHGPPSLRLLPARAPPL
jgi:hypothetical protein